MHDGSFIEKLLTVLFVSFFAFVLADSTYASENNDVDAYVDLSKGEITYQDEEITVYNFGNDPEIARKIEESQTSVTSSVLPSSGSLSQITPFKTVTGVGGKVTIDAGDSGQIIYWSVKPTSKWPWVFEDEIQLRYYSGFKRDQDIYGYGLLGTSSNGVVTMNKNNGGIATLKGTAYSSDYSTFTVLPGASVPFKKK